MIMARPLTPEERADLKKRLPDALIKNYGYLTQCAEDLGVSRPTITRLIEEDEQLQEAQALAKALVQERLAHRVTSAGLGDATIPSNQVTMTIFASKVIGGLSEVQRLEHGGKVEWGTPPSAPKAEATDDGDQDTPPVLSLIK